MQKEFISKKPEIFRKTAVPQKRFKINLSPLRSAFYIALIIGAVYLVFFSQVFKIKNVEIDGVKSVEIADYLKSTLIGKNIVLLRTGKYLDELTEKFPVLESARIIRGLPSTVKVVIGERRQVLIWCQQMCFEVDSYGYAYDELETVVQDRIVIKDTVGTKYKIGDKIVSSDYIAFFMSALDKIESNGLKVKEAEVDQTVFKLAFVTMDGWKIIVDPSESLSNQMYALKQILEKNRADLKDYVDLRVEGLAYIK